jgi:hypothetical protein
MFTPSDAYSIDSKIDDGLPASGTVVQVDTPGFSDVEYGYPACTTTTVAATAQYALSLNGQGCNLGVNAGF